MNRAAARLWLAETHYSTPAWPHDPGNHSRPHDLAKLAAILLRNPLFSRIVDTPRAKLGEGPTVRHVTNTNTLLRRAPFVDGVEPGTPDLAGDVLVSSGPRHGVTLIAVVLGAPDEPSRDQGSLDLLRYGFSRYSDRPAARGGEVFRGGRAGFGGAPLGPAASHTVRV